MINSYHLIVSGKLRRYASSSSSDTSSSESSLSSDSSSSESSTEDEDSSSKRQTKTIARPGFSRHLKSALLSKISDHKSPLRVEINNDHFKKE